MDRRKFLKSIGKVVAGCAIVPSASEAKPQLTVAKLMEAKKALDATIDEDFLIPVDGEVIAEYLELDYYGNWPACRVKPDGIEFIHYKDFYKTKLV